MMKKMRKKMENKKFDVIVVGELNVDLILNQIESFPEISKEKIAQKMDLTLGSSSAIFASNISTLGLKVAFLGKIGKDNFGDFIIDELKKKNVDTNFIIRDDNSKTGITIVLNFDEDRAMVTYTGAMAELTFKELNGDVISYAKHLHFSSFYLQKGLKPNVSDLFALAKEKGLTTSFDMQWDPEEKWDMNYKEILPNVDIFFPNKMELLLLTGEKDINKGLEKLAKYGNSIVVKMGNKGSVSWDKKKITHVKPFLNKNVVDSIGAGDSFNAGYIFKYLQGAGTIESQKFANLIGAINTTAAGGTGAFTCYENIMEIAKVKFGFSET